MGGGASVENTQLAKLEYLAQRNKPLDGNDCEDLAMAKIEIGKLRTLCRFIDPQLVDELLIDNKDKESIKSIEKVQKIQEKEENPQIISMLQEKLENRLISLNEAFRKIDITNTGYITKEEFIQACWYWGIQLEESDFNHFTSILGPSNSRIQYNEFIRLMSQLLDQKGVIIEKENQTDITSRPLTAVIQSNTTADILRSRILDSGLTMKQAFLKFDKNGSGSIEKDEMKQVLKQFNVPFTEMELVNLFEKYDVNRDQKFQYGEFVRIIQMRS